MYLSNKKKSALLTVSILVSLAAPVYAAEAINAGTTREVVVTATRTEEEVKTVPSTVEVITQDDIQNSVRLTYIPHCVWLLISI